MTLMSQSSGTAAVLALEGSTCQEYFLHANDLEPAQVAELVTEQDFEISSSGSGHRQTHSYSSTSSEDANGLPNGVSTTVKKRSKGEFLTLLL